MHFITTQPHENLKKFESTLTTTLLEQRCIFAYQKDKSVLGLNKSFFKVKNGLILNLLNVVLKKKLKNWHY